MELNTTLWILGAVIQASIALLVIVALFVALAFQVLYRETPRARAYLGLAWSEGSFLAVVFTSLVSLFYSLTTMFCASWVDPSILHWLVAVGILLFIPVVISFVLAMIMILAKIRPSDFK